MNTRFIDFNFVASGAPTARNLPYRLSEIVNVKDWGAAPANSAAANTTAINNAIAYACSLGGGTVFFPSGAYSTNAIVAGYSSNVGVVLLGSGKGGTTITGAISKGAQTYDALERVEALTAGGITATRDGVAIHSCMSSGNPGIDTTGANGASVIDCWVTGSAALRADQSSFDVPGGPAGTIAFKFGTGTTAIDCRTTGAFDIAYAMSGDGASLIGCSAENNNTAVRLGWNGAEALARGCSVINFQTEATDCCFDLYYCEGCILAGNFGYSTKGTPEPSPIQNITWSSGSGGVAHVTTTLPHNLPAGTYPLQLYGMVPTSFYQEAGLGWITATRTGASTFDYIRTSDPGTFTSGNWLYPPRYGIRCRKVTETTLMGNSLGSHFCVVASLDLDYDGEAVDHRNNTIIDLLTPYGCILPTDTTNLAGWKFIFTGGASDVGPTPFNTLNNPYGGMSFTDLPGQSGVAQDGPFEGQEFDIIDGNGAGTFDATVTSSGSGHWKVRHNGTDWKRIG